MGPHDSSSDKPEFSPAGPPPDAAEFDALPPSPAPRGLMKPKLRVYHWILIALLLGGLVALLLVGVASE
ncbi:MAG TPA: hypothetical protein VMJ93_06445 [Verrucomicrobiae bacterium]|nr:hypothetical protein [Verrucomicrobiae bacterium]